MRFTRFWFPKLTCLLINSCDCPGRLGSSPLRNSSVASHSTSTPSTLIRIFVVTKPPPQFSIARLADLALTKGFIFSRDHQSSLPTRHEKGVAPSASYFLRDHVSPQLLVLDPAQVSSSNLSQHRARQGSEWIAMTFFCQPGLHSTEVLRLLKETGLDKRVNQVSQLWCSGASGPRGGSQSTTLMSRTRIERAAPLGVSNDLPVRQSIDELLYLVGRDAISAPTQSFSEPFPD